MNTQAESAASVIDVVKQVFSFVFVVAGISAFYYFSEAPTIYRVIGLLVVLALAVVVMLSTENGKAAGRFVLESRQEVRKVVWPSRDETVRTTLMVFAMVSIVGVVLWILDTMLFSAVRFLTGQGG